MIHRREFLRTSLAMAVADKALAQSPADHFPSRPVRIVVPYGAGTSTDLSSRMLAEGLSKSWNVPVTVENVPAASGMVGTDMVAKLPPNGYNLVMVASNHIINPYLYKGMSFDALKDFTPIAMVGRTQIVMVVNSQSDILNIASLIKKAKASPGKLNYGSAGNGSVGQLNMEQFKLDMAVSITHIPYRAQGQALTDLMAGQVDVALPALGVGLPLVRSGKLRAIGVVSTTRSPFAPEIPTVQEQTGRAMEGIAWWGLLGPKNLPADIVDTINAAIQTQLQAPGNVERMRAQGFEAVLGSPGEMAETMRNDFLRVGHIVKAASIKID